MRHFFTLTIMLVALLTGAFYYICYTPALVQKEAPAFIAKFFKDVTLNSLTIGGQSFAYPEILKLYNIKAEIEWQNETYQIEIAELDFLNFQTFLGSPQQAQIELAGFNIHRTNLEILNAALSLTVNLENKAFKNADILVRDGEFKVKSYRLTSTKAHIQASKENLKITDFKAQTYGGETKGNIEMIFDPHLSQTALLEFKGLKSQELVAVNKTVFSQLEGQLTGNVRLTQVDGLLQVFVILAEMPGGATIKTALAKRVLSYMTNEDHRDKVSAYLDSKSQLEFETAEFRILNISRNLAAVTFTLTNKKEDLLVHETINIDIARILKKIAWTN